MESAHVVPTDGDQQPPVSSTQTNGIQTNGAHTNGDAGVNGAAHKNPYDIPLNSQYAFTPRKIRIITIGAGFSGLLMAHKFQHRYPEMQEFMEHTIYEGRKEIGGTWLVNTYPGVQCDVPSHIYVSKESLSEGYFQSGTDIFQGLPV